MQLSRPIIVLHTIMQLTIVNLFCVCFLCNPKFDIDRHNLCMHACRRSSCYYAANNLQHIPIYVVLRDDLSRAIAPTPHSHASQLLEVLDDVRRECRRPGGSPVGLRDAGRAAIEKDETLQDIRDAAQQYVQEGALTVCVCMHACMCLLCHLCLRPSVTGCCSFS